MNIKKHPEEKMDYNKLMDSEQDPNAYYKRNYQKPEKVYKTYENNEKQSTQKVIEIFLRNDKECQNII